MSASAFLAALQKAGAILEDKGSINLARFREVLEDTCGPDGIIEPLPDET